MTSTILVIDDHPETVQLITLTLRRHGYNVEGAESGAEGIRMAEELLPDVILLDVMMPDMDGLTVCRHLREIEQLSAIPVIMFTAKSRAQDKLRGFEAGANDYLTKPTQPKELISRVEAVHPLTRAGKPGEATFTDDLEQTSLVVVSGARGGAGATTVAVNLAVAVSEVAGDTILADMDVRQGHVAIYLGKKVVRDSLAWLSLAPDTFQRQLFEYLVPYDERLRLLLSKAHLMERRNGLSAARWQAAASAFRHSGHHVVVDMGRGAENSLPLLKAADQVVLCMRPERAAIIGTRNLLVQLKNILPSLAAIRLLMINYGPGTRLPRELVENFLGMPLLGMISLSPKEISQAVDRAQPLIRLQSQSEVSREFRDLARQLVAASSNG